jgi:threonine dehydratase
MAVVTIADIEAAANLLRPHVHRTPVLASRTLNERAGNELLF